MEPTSPAGSPLRLAVVGVGGMAHWQHLPNLRGLADQAQVVAMVDVNASNLQRAATAYGVEQTFATVGDLLRARLDLDAALVITPPPHHAEPAVELLQAAIPVFCEKPLAYRLEEAEEIVLAATEAGVPLAVGFNRRFAATVRAAKEMLQSARPQLIVAEKSKPMARVDPDWLIEAPIHALDTLRWLADSAVSDLQVTAATDPHSGQETVTALIRFVNGCIGIFASNTGGAKWVERYEVFADTTTAIIEYPVRIRRFMREETPLSQALAADLTPAPEHLEIGTLDDEPILQLANTLYPTDEAIGLGFRAELIHFLDCVRQRSQPLASGVEALTTQRLAQQIVEAAGLRSSTPA